MAAEIPGGVDRRQRSRDKLDALVSSRTATLSLLTELASRQPFNPEPSVEKALRSFCEALIDYTASAHFQLYRFLAFCPNCRRPLGIFPLPTNAASFRYRF